MNAPTPATRFQLVDEAMTAIERDNSSFKGDLPKDYARPGLDKTRLGQLVDVVSNSAVGDRIPRVWRFSEMSPEASSCKVDVGSKRRRSFGEFRPTEAPMTATLRSHLRGHDNALNAPRLALAVAVIVHHAWPLGGFGVTPMFTGIIPNGRIAVDGFFCISGYLIAQSRLRMGFRPYMWRRARRILPAFWVCLVVTALIIAPLSTRISLEQYNPADAARYVLRNSALYVRQSGVTSTLRSVPYPIAWNGSLWSLFYEFGAYIVAGLLLGVPFVKRHLGVVCLVLLAMVAIALPLAHGPLNVTTDIYLKSLRLGSFFIGGMVLYALGPRIPASGWLALAALLIQGPLFKAGWVAYDALAPLPLAYLLLWLGGALQTRIGAKNDVSYGMYIYAFPVQQVLALSGGMSLGFAPFAFLSIALTVPLAWASWFAVEKPSMRMRHLIPARGRRGGALDVSERTPDRRS